MLAFAAAVPTASLLAGTSWSVALDIGAERGSWMPPTWGRSGARCTPTVRVSLEEGERVLLRETGEVLRLSTAGELEAPAAANALSAKGGDRPI